jgi:hypothetical protein
MSASAQAQVVGKTWVLSATSGGSASQPSHYALLGGASATAIWRDVLFLGSTDPQVVGSTLRLSFVATGSMDTNEGPSAVLTQKSVLISGGDSSGSASAQLGEFGPQGWDSLVVNGTSYVGTFHADIAIIPGFDYVPSVPGSFGYEVTASADTVVQDGNIVNPFAAVSDPAQFLSITLPDKGNVTPESLGVSLTFDSGIASPNFAAVPEPATLTLLGLGVASVIGHRWRRRRQKANA